MKIEKFTKKEKIFYITLIFYLIFSIIFPAITYRLGAESVENDFNKTSQTINIKESIKDIPVKKVNSNTNNIQVKYCDILLGMSTTSCYVGDLYIDINVYADYYDSSTGIFEGAPKKLYPTSIGYYLSVSKMSTQSSSSSKEFYCSFSDMYTFSESFYKSYGLSDIWWIAINSIDFSLRFENIGTNAAPNFENYINFIFFHETGNNHYSETSIAFETELSSSWHFEEENIPKYNIFFYEIENSIPVIDFVENFLDFNIQVKEYEDGYSKGYTDGFTNGKNVGFDQGAESVENSNSVFNSVWVIISNATNAIFNVFDFDIFPGFPFYIVIALPIVVSILFFILKVVIK